MQKILKIAGAGIAGLLIIALLAAGWFFFLHGRPGPGRPDLVRLPDNAPEAPKGFPTMNYVYAAIWLNAVELHDMEEDIDETGVEIERDVEYGNVDGRALLLDVYRPETKPEAPVPGLMFIHGGGWSKGDKGDYKYYCVEFARKGYTVVSVGYRLTGEALYPACIEDVKCATRWYRKNAADLNVDPDRIVAIGGSAGGHLAMMIGYSHDVPELDGTGGHADTSSEVAAVVNLYGPTDLTTPEAQEHPTVLGFFEDTYAVDPEPYRMASPLTHLDANDPPTLTMHGDIDHVCPVEQADLLAERMQELDIPYWYDRLHGFPHTMDLVPAINDRVVWMIQAFLEEHLPGGTAPVG